MESDMRAKRTITTQGIDICEAIKTKGEEAYRVNWLRAGEKEGAWETLTVDQKNLFLAGWMLGVGFGMDIMQTVQEKLRWFGRTKEKILDELSNAIHTRPVV